MEGDFIDSPPVNVATQTDTDSGPHHETFAVRQYNSIIPGDYVSPGEQKRIEASRNPLTRKYLAAFKAYVVEKVGIDEPKPVEKIEDIQHHHSQDAAHATRFISAFLKGTRDWSAVSSLIRARRVSGEQLWDNKTLLAYTAILYGQELLLRLTPGKSHEHPKEQSAREAVVKLMNQVRPELGEEWNPIKTRDDETREIWKGYVAANAPEKYDFTTKCSETVSLQDPESVSNLLHHTVNAMRDLQPSVKRKGIMWGYMQYPQMAKQRIEEIAPEISFPIAFGRTNAEGNREYAVVYHSPQDSVEDITQKVTAIFANKDAWQSKTKIARAIIGVELDDKALYDQSEAKDMLLVGEKGKPMFVFMGGANKNTGQREVHMVSKHLPVDGELNARILRLANAKSVESTGQDFLHKDHPLERNAIRLEFHQNSIITQYNKDLDVPASLRLDSYLWFLQEWVRHYKTIAKTDKRFEKYRGMPDTVSANSPVSPNDGIGSIGIAAIGRHDPEAIPAGSVFYDVRYALASISTMNQFTVEKDGIRDAKVGEPLPKCLAAMKPVGESSLPEPVVRSLMHTLDSAILAPARASLVSAMTLTQDNASADFSGIHITPGSIDYIGECGIQGVHTRTNVYTWNSKSTLFPNREMFVNFVNSAAELRREYELLQMQWATSDQGLEEFSKNIERLNVKLRSRLQQSTI